MSSSKLRAAASSSGVLIADALYEILLRVPAKDLCRSRAVCRAWCALTSDPLFAAAHKSHQKAPLLALAYRSTSNKKESGVDIVDLSGNILRRIPSIEDDIDPPNQCLSVLVSCVDIVIRVLPTRLDLICFTRDFHSLGLWVLNPATGATIALPECRSEEFAGELHLGYDIKVESHALGRVSSTGEYKVLRVSRLCRYGRQVCEVITLDGINHGRWRRKQSPQSPIGTSREMRSVTVDGVVYFLIDFVTSFFRSGLIDVEPACIASFNLETEEGMGTIRGPASVLKFIQDSEQLSYMQLHMQLSLAEMDGCIVTVHNAHYGSMDLWFLTDIENDIWVKKYIMPLQDPGVFVHPFLVLDDGRILLRHGLRSLKYYDPRTGTYADALEVRDSRSIAIYTGNLLSL